MVCQWVQANRFSYDFRLRWWVWLTFSRPWWFSEWNEWNFQVRSSQLRRKCRHLYQRGREKVPYRENISSFPSSSVRLWGIYMIKWISEKDLTFSQGDLSAKGIVQVAGKYVPGDRVKEINATVHSRFIDDNPSVPKVLLFTEKKGVPLIYRALSIALDVKTPHKIEMKFWISIKF